MTKRMAHRAAALAIAAAAALLLLPSFAAAKPKAGPKLAKCGKFKQTNEKRWRKCLTQNKANRVAFNQIKNSNLLGTRGDGEDVDWTFCANGKWETRTSSSSGTGVSTGKRWWVVNARVKNGGKWINAFVGAPGGFEVGVERRGKQWKVGVSSFDRIIYPGDVDKTNGTGACRTLDV
ncbi:MAG: hypothetical protein R2725_01260 [Solirubrobacterales bacterium]